MKLSSLKPGQTVLAGYIRGDRRFFDEAVFLGATWCRRCIKPIPSYETVGEMKAQTGPGYRNLRDLEADLDAEGCTAYAVFQDPEDGSTWAAYLWEGAWRVGSSADRLRLLVAD